MHDICRGVGRLILFLTLITILAPLQGLLIFWKPYALPFLFHRLMRYILRINLHQIGVPERALWVSNHLSWLDILVLGSISPLAFISKHEVASWPLFGQLARLQKTIFIQREQPLEVLSSLKKIKQRLNESPLVLFAEGTTGDGSCVLPFLSSLIFPPTQPITLFYKDYSAIAWYGDMCLLPHFWAIFKRKKTDVYVVFHPLLKEGKRKDIATQAEKHIRETYMSYLQQ